MNEFNRDNSATIDKLIRERDEALAEVEEQSRLIKELVFEVERQEAENERLREQFETARLVSKAKQERLAKCCTQRGSRMQIMRDWLDSNRGLGPPTEWWYFCEERPEAKSWFDEDGVPVT